MAKHSLRDGPGNPARRHPRCQPHYGRRVRTTLLHGPRPRDQPAGYRRTRSRRPALLDRGRSHGQHATPVFSGLVPGDVGLYQVNVQVPAGVAKRVRCGSPFPSAEQRPILSPWRFSSDCPSSLSTAVRGSARTRTSYLPAPAGIASTLPIHAAIFSSASGANVSSICAYSENAPVLACWNR